MIAIMLPVPGRFFLELFLEDRLVPYDGTACTEFVISEMGGDPFRIPLACLVTPEAAASALSEFIKTRQKPSCLSWMPMGNVPFEAGWYDD